MTGTGSEYRLRNAGILIIQCITTYAHELEPSQSKHKEKADKGGRLPFNIPAVAPGKLVQG